VVNKPIPEIGLQYYACKPIKAALSNEANCMTEQSSEQSLDKISEKPISLKTLQQDPVQYPKGSYGQILNLVGQTVKNLLYLLIGFGVALGTISTLQGGQTIEDFIYKTLPFLIATTGASFVWLRFYVDIEREKSSYLKERLVELECDPTRLPNGAYQLKVENIGTGPAYKVAVTIEGEHPPKVVKSVVAPGRAFTLRLDKIPEKSVFINFENIDRESLPPVILLPD
jgi:hypothetical protein